MKGVVYIILLLFTWIVPSNLGAQIELDNLSFVKVKDGISKSPISKIIQSTDKYIWIATRGSGLYRFDGTNYISYTFDWEDKATISSNFIYTMYIDTKGQLWVGTDVGLNRYNKKLDNFERIDLSEVNKPENGSTIDVRCIVEDEKGNLLLGTYGKGIIQIYFQENSIAEIKIDVALGVDVDVYAFQKNIKQEIFVATSLGLRVLNKEKGTLEPIKIQENADRKYVDDVIQVLTLDENENLWASTTQHGLLKLKYEKNAYSISRFSTTKKKILALTSIDNQILVGTENDGLYILANDGTVLKKCTRDFYDKSNLGSNSVWSLFVDMNKRIWIGYFDRGVQFYDKKYSKFESFKIQPNNTNSLQASSITSITKDGKGRFWFGMGLGIDIYEPESDTYFHINGVNDLYQGFDSNVSVIDIYIDKRENVWIGTWSSGLYLLRKGSEKFERFSLETVNGSSVSNGVLCFAEDAKGRIWMGTPLSGVHYYDPSTNRIMSLDLKGHKIKNLANADVKEILVDNNDKVWVGATDGLFTIKEDKGKFAIVSMMDSILFKAKDYSNVPKIQSLFQDSQDRIWIGTNGAGILCYDTRENQFSYDALSSDFQQISVNAIIESEDRSLWISGKSGITRVDPTGKEIVNYTVGDGLLGNYYNNSSVFQDEDGVIYFGGYDGINYFHPTQITTNDVEPILHFTNLKIFNKIVKPTAENSPLKKSISETQELTLKYNQTTFTIDYVGINYTRPEKTEYAYYMEGSQDPDWNYVGNVQSANYNNLAAGNYTFRVKASNNDGVWTSTPLSLKIKILPPWWKSNLAYALYCLVFLSGLYGTIAFFRNRFKEKQTAFLESNRIAQEEKLIEKKIQFFTNLSHEFRTPLTLILTPLADIIKDEQLSLPIYVQNKHKIIYKNADRLSRLINELMDFRKLQSDGIDIQVQEVDIIRATSHTLDYFREEAAYRKIKLELKADDETLMTWLDFGMLEKILFNLISNAFKVTPDNGSIRISIRQNQNMILPQINNDIATPAVEISVKDTGPGINKNEQEKIFERFYQLGNFNKSYYGSTGIGLEMVRNFMQLHRGEITVISEEGKGAEFIMTFPIHKSAYREQDIVTGQSLANQVIQDTSLHPTIPDEEQGVDSITKEYTLLLVEDNPDLLKYLSQELDKIYNILTASNGRIGLQVALEKTPDVILTDVVMPDMDGLELCEAIKNDIKTSHIPLLMLTAKAMDEDKLQGISAGADAYLIKPFNVEVLKATIEQVIKSRQILFQKPTPSSPPVNGLEATSLDSAFIKKALAYIDENLSEPNLNVEVLAKHFFLSRSQFYRKVKMLTGYSATEFIRKVKLAKAKDLLIQSNKNVSEVTYIVGFSSPSYFTKSFKKEFGCLPSEAHTLAE